MFGQDAATPVVSLRLKQLSEGIDDYDYLCLAKDFIGPDYVTNILKSGVTPSEALAVFYHYTQLDYLCKIFNRQYVYAAWSCRFMNITRHYIGNALDAANIEHDWSEWQTAVLPDATHCGLEIRTCSHCGAQESRDFNYKHQTMSLDQGVNWFSTNLDVTLEDLQTALVAAVAPNTTITIKNATQSVVYSRNHWNGTLDWDVAKKYNIKVASACELTLEGMPIDPSEHPITVVGGGMATWIGFPLDESMTLTNAFAGFAQDGDIVKTQYGNAIYSRGHWNGEFYLEPGQGYLYISAPTAADRVLVYPASAK